MIKILFICYGNICRSPMAESVMTHLVKERGLESEFQIDSAAVSREEIGNPVHRGTRNKLKEKKIGVVDHRARQINLDDITHFDYIICMDESNVKMVEALFWGYEAYEKNKAKVRLLLDFAPSRGRREIADPWYTGDFEETYEDVIRGCEGLLEDCLKS